MNESHHPSRFSRRQAAAGLAGGSVVAATMFQLVRAQDSATPAPTTDNDDASTSSNTADDADHLATAITRAQETISEVQADLEAVTNDIDPAGASDLLAQAIVLVDNAENSLATGDASQLRYQVRGARGIAEAAQFMIVAQLTYPGLPSQADRAVRTLTDSFGRVTELTAAEPVESTVDLSGVTGDAQATYTTAYELNTSGAFAQAIAFARVASQLAEAGLTLGGQESGGNGRGASSRGGRSGMSDKPLSDDSASATPTIDTTTPSDTVETPPAPDFGG